MLSSEDLKHIRLPPTADFHVHLRDGKMMELVTPLIRQGGTDLAYVMPNLVPPLTSVDAVEQYYTKLCQLSKETQFLMTLYLHPSITPEVVTAAAASRLVYGIKSYPAGVTTNSQSGVYSYEPYYPVFEKMQEAGLVLNLHGETPSRRGGEEAEVNVMNAEDMFLPTLLDLHKKFPRLKIVLEHATTANAVKAVLACGETVGATITAHHLHLTVDDWVGQPLNYCKPVAKTNNDRTTLLRAAFTEYGQGKFFFGSDSAPHDIRAKRGSGMGTCAAGVFTQPHVTQHVLEALRRALDEGCLREEELSRDSLIEFLSLRGRRFYGVLNEDQRKAEPRMILRAQGEKIENSLKSKDGNIEVIEFRAGEDVLTLSWE